MTHTETLEYSILTEIKDLISEQKFIKAEEALHQIENKTGEWHFLYSSILLARAWFDSAKEHLQTAISLDPENNLYQEELVKLSYRNRSYSDDYYNGPYRRRRSSCCCCCNCCDCDISCCDLICADTCCECMGGDLISCI